MEVQLCFPSGLQVDSLYSKEGRFASHNSAWSCASAMETGYERKTCIDHPPPDPPRRRFAPSSNFADRRRPHCRIGRPGPALAPPWPPAAARRPPPAAHRPRVTGPPAGTASGQAQRPARARARPHVHGPPRPAAAAGQLHVIGHAMHAYGHFKLGASIAIASPRVKISYN